MGVVKRIAGWGFPEPSRLPATRQGMQCSYRRKEIRRREKSGRLSPL